MAKSRNPDRDKFLDFAAFLPEATIDVVFDIGANVGQSTRQFRRRFPEARIWAFEPVPAAFGELKQAVGDDPRTRTVPAAFGAQPGKGFITADGTRPVNHLVEESAGVNVEPVRIMTGDAFCEARNIERINFAKIDTEGHDLEVLKGFDGMLRDHRLDLVQVEAAMTPRQPQHVPLNAFQEHLQPLGYFLFRIYDQISRRHPGGPELALVNAVFVSDPVINQNTRRRGADRASVA